MSGHLNAVLNQRYRLVEFLGHGNFGEVYRGTTITPGQPGQSYCIRMLAPENPQRRPLLDAFPELARADVPGLLPWIELGRAATGPATGYTFLVSPLAEPLGRRLTSGPLEPAEVCRLAEQVAGALEALHEQGLVYAKLSPNNVVTYQGQWLLSDREMVRGPQAGWLEEYLGRAPVDFVAPELWLRHCTPAADVWALGLMLLACLGHPLPWRGTGWAYELSMGPMPLPASLPLPLDLILRGCLLREPERRWSSTNVLQALRGEPVIVDTSWRQPFAVDAPLPRRANPTGCQALEGHYSEVRALAVSADGVVSGSLDGSVYLWTLEGHRFKSLGTHPGAVRRLCFAHPGGPLASACRAGVVHVWDVATRTQVATVTLSAPVQDVQFGGSELWVLLDDGTLYRWDWSVGELHAEEPVPLATCLDPVGDGLVWGRLDGQIVERHRGPLARHQGPVSQVLRVQGELLSCGRDGWFQRALKPLLQTPTELWCMTVRNGWLATAGLNRVIYVNPPEGPFFALRGHSLAVTGLGFSADGRHLVSASRDRTILLWDLDTVQREPL